MITETIKQIQALREELLKNASPELEQVNAALAEARGHRDSIDNAFISGLVTAENRDYWNEKLASIRKEIEQFESRKRELQAIADTDLGVYEDAASMAKALKYYADSLAKTETPHEKRNAILALVKRIDLQDDGTPMIRFADGVHKRAGWLPD